VHAKKLYNEQKCHHNPKKTATLEDPTSVILGDPRETAHEVGILVLTIEAEDSDTDNEQIDENYSLCILCDVCTTKCHSVSFQDVFTGEWCTLCPTQRGEDVSIG
jgi:hypothetical protein